MVRVNICGLLWLSGWKDGSAMRDALRAQNFARRRKSRQPPSVIRMIEVMRIRITCSAAARGAEGLNGHR